MHWQLTKLLFIFVSLRKIYISCIFSEKCWVYDIYVEYIKVLGIIKSCAPVNTQLLKNGEVKNYILEMHFSICFIHIFRKVLDIMTCEVNLQFHSQKIQSH